MRRANSRIKSRARLPVQAVRGHEKSAPGVVAFDVTMRDATRVFELRTGLDAKQDASLHVLIGSIKTGLKLAAVPAPNRSELRDAPVGVEVVPWRPSKGRPALPRALTRPLAHLVAWLGPTDAALALLLFGLHARVGFISASARRTGRAYDVRDVLRRVERRLVQIAAAEAAAEARSRPARRPRRPATARAPRAGGG